MGNLAQGGGMSADGMAHAASDGKAGAFTRFGLAVAAIVCVLDQALKLWLIFVFDLEARGPVRLAPGVDLVMTWNKGISYGLFPQDSDGGRWLLIGISIAAAILLTIWLTRTR